MSEQYTTTTDDVRLEYMAVRWGKNDTVSFEARAEFDRWLARRDAEVAAKALEDAADEIDRRRNEPILIQLDVKYAGYYTGVRSAMGSDSEALRASAERYRKSGERNE